MIAQLGDEVVQRDGSIQALQRKLASMEEAASELNSTVYKLREHTRHRECAPTVALGVFIIRGRPEQTYRAKQAP